MTLGISLLPTPVLSAAPLTVSGNITAKYQSQTSLETPVESGTTYSISVRGEQSIAKNMSLFLRFSAQYATNPQLGDFDVAFQGINTKMVAGFDQFGLIYKPKNFTFILGRQEAQVGKTALLYSRSETNIGYNRFVDGLSVNASEGSFKFMASAVWENNFGLPNNNYYALRTGYNLSKASNIGFTWAQYKYVAGNTTQHWAVDATTTLGKNAFTAEYAQSNSAESNKAYALTWDYDFDGKTAFYVKHFRVEANADMGGQSDFDNNNRGFHYGLTHLLSNKLSVEFIFKDQFSLADNAKNSKIEIWLKNSF